MLAPREAPLEFQRTHIRIQDARGLRACKSAGEVDSIIRSTLTTLGIKKRVVAFSKIGNSILELYTATRDRDEILEAFARYGVEVIQNFDVLAAAPHVRMHDPTPKVINRLTYLYRRAHVMNMRACILAGYPDEISNAVRLAVEGNRRAREPKQEQVESQADREARAAAVVRDREQIDAMEEQMPAAGQPMATPEVAMELDEEVEEGVVDLAADVAGDEGQGITVPAASPATGEITGAGPSSQ